MGLDDLNALSPTVAMRAFLQCCGSTKWADAMAAARPFATIEAVYAAADKIDASLEPPDWLEAFHAHPRIGERAAAGTSWSSDEQGGAHGASDAVRDRLAARNRDYEARFGYIFIVCATGRTADEMLADLERRLAHRAGDELSVAAMEQRKITSLVVVENDSRLLGIVHLHDLWGTESI